MKTLAVFYEQDSGLGGYIYATDATGARRILRTWCASIAVWMAARKSGQGADAPGTELGGWAVSPPDEEAVAAARVAVTISAVSGTGVASPVPAGTVSSIVAPSGRGGTITSSPPPAEGGGVGALAVGSVTCAAGPARWESLSSASSMSLRDASSALRHSHGSNSR